MMYTKTQMLTMELINNYKPLTKADAIRLDTAKKRLMTAVYTARLVRYSDRAKRLLLKMYIAQTP